MLIGLTGLKRSGKDTAADHLIQNMGFERTYFAQPLKEMLITLYRCAGIDQQEIDRRLHGDLKEAADPILLGQTPRWAMQTLGTEWRDLIDRELWTSIWISKVEPMLLSGQPVVVTDVRFLHEAKRIRQLGGYIVQVHRPSLPYSVTDLHASEQEMLRITPDTTITNDGTIADLHKKMEGVYLDFSEGH